MRKAGWARFGVFALALIAMGGQSFAQSGQVLSPAPQVPAAEPVGRVAAAYVLGPSDVILIRAFEAEEISEKPFRVDEQGILNLPLVGRIQAAGMTVEKLEALLIERLRPHVRNPQVVVTITQFRTDPVFVVGAFRNPGIYPLQGRRTLMEVLAAAGGLQPNAGRRVKLTRRIEWGAIPLPGAVEDTDRQTSEIEISLSRLMETVNPAEDLLLQPYDTVRVAPRETVYVNGEVLRPGMIELFERDYISATQAVSMSGGLSRDARPERAVVLRPVLDTAKRAEIPLDLRRVYAGLSNDFALQPNDILVVPRKTRSGFITALTYMAPAAVTSLIYVLARRW